jgi:hypothetical protein
MTAIPADKQPFTAADGQIWAILKGHTFGCAQLLVGALSVQISDKRLIENLYEEAPSWE